MPWVRIDEHALSHIKLRVLSNGAFRLWVEGLAYCQQQLTDGVISAAALRTFVYRTPARLKELTRSVDGRPALWRPAGDGFQVHDYLQWNDRREDVLEKRAKARERMSRLREGRSHCRSDEAEGTDQRAICSPELEREQPQNVPYTTPLPHHDHDHDHEEQNASRSALKREHERGAAREREHLGPSNWDGNDWRAYEAEKRRRRGQAPRARHPPQ